MDEETEPQQSEVMGQLPHEWIRHLRPREQRRPAQDGGRPKAGLSPGLGPPLLLPEPTGEFALDTDQKLRLQWTYLDSSHVPGTGPPQHLPTAAPLTHGAQKVQIL